MHSADESPRPALTWWGGTQHARRFLPKGVSEDEQHGGCGGRLRLPRRQKAKVGSGCSEGKRQKWEVDAQCLSASQWWVSLYLLPFTFCLLPFLVLFQSAIQNPKSRIQNRVSALRRS